MRYKMRKIITKLELTPEETRNLQMNILEIMIEFDRICRKNGISYSIDGGTFLGAVRHKGFIPWDTDADIVIMRKDYERFKEVCANDLDKDRFFLQDYKTDNFYRWGYARLLLKGTEYKRAGYEHIQAKNGVFLDIFAMDSVPESYFMRRIHRFACFCTRKLLWSEAGKVVHPNPIIRKIFLVLSLIPKSTIFQFINWVIKICDKEDTELVCHMCSPHPAGYPYGFPRKLFSSLNEYEFEGCMFLGFADYDWYLRSIYDDYMTLPAEQDRISHIPCSTLKLLNKDNGGCFHE